MNTTIDHIGIAVADVEAALITYTQHMGFEVECRERLEERAVEVIFLRAGSTRLELLIPLGDGPVARYLEKHGPGIHHICYEVADIRAELARLQGLGYTAIDTEPRPGAEGAMIAFLKPAQFAGVLTELSEKSKEFGSEHDGSLVAEG